MIIWCGQNIIFVFIIFFSCRTVQYSVMWPDKERRTWGHFFPSGLYYFADWTVIIYYKGPKINHNILKGTRFRYVHTNIYITYMYILYVHKWQQSQRVRLKTLSTTIIIIVSLRVEINTLNNIALYNNIPKINLDIILYIILKYW